MDIQRGQVGPDATTLVFVLDPRHRARLPRVQSGMLAAAGSDAGFFVGGEDKFIVLEGFAVPGSLIKVEQATSLAGEVGVARKDPTAVAPGANGVLGQPPSDGASRDADDQAGLTDLAPELARAPARQGDALGGWQLTGEGLDLNDQFWGESPGPARARTFFEAGQTLLEEPFAPQADDLAAGVETSGDLVVGQALGGKENHLGADHFKIRQRILGARGDGVHALLAGTA